MSPAASWDIAQPVRAGRMAGVSMAGFRQRNSGSIEERVVPHPAVTVILEFGDSSLVVDDAAGRIERGSLAAGLGAGAVRLRGSNIGCVEVRLSPVIAPAVLGARPAELNPMVALDDLWGRDAERLREQLGAAASWGERFTLTEAFLARRRTAGPPMDPEVAWAWQRITRSRGRLRVEDLAVEIGWSRKRLWGRFRSQVGLAPKRATKLVRFDHAAHCLAAGRSPARVSAECGYVDQSHLHRDVLAFSGATPVTLTRHRGFAATHTAFSRAGTFVQDLQP
ncbi:helix-turn-helix domain-containing protein [Nocardia sp. NPDC020380]|uniref:helix-turn-helix domain-containing protein n=1 Tax=Nocardia sp. NPDC020380 TaxID=3364309 RepID=UPI0037A18AAA